MDTVFARSTAPGRAGVAIVRISGPRAWDAARRLTRAPLPEVRRLVRRRLVGGDGLIDDAMLVLFPEGASFTGEASVELHLHGSEAVLRAVLSELGRLPGFRPAEAGEFTRRALENDRIGLAEVEGLSALLEAESAAQHRLAMQVFAGGLRERVEHWRDRLISSLAQLEVTIDFPDEEVPQEVELGLATDLRDLVVEVRREADGVASARKIAGGFEVALVGPVNSGKSTLLNHLAGREAAITSDIAGTTRDVIEVRMELHGHLVTLLDTAGIRDTGDAVERIGVERARARAEAADLRVFLDAVPEGVGRQPSDILLRGKADLRAREESPPPDALAVSGLTGEGVPALLDRIARALSDRVQGAGLAMTDRQEVALRRAAEALAEGASMLEAGLDPELVSAQVRDGVASLDALVGRIGPEDVLGAIFSRFCIGK